MPDFLIGWLSIVIIVGCICLTIVYIVKLHYRDQKEQRLEQMDVQLQNPQLAADTLTVKKIAQSYQKNAEFDALVLRDVKSELLARNLINEK